MWRAEDDCLLEVRPARVSEVFPNPLWADPLEMDAFNKIPRDRQFAIKAGLGTTEVPSIVLSRLSPSLCRVKIGGSLFPIPGEEHLVVLGIRGGTPSRHT